MEGEKREDKGKRQGKKRGKIREKGKREKVKNEILGRNFKACGYSKKPAAPV
jgi:hypothetical protein